MPKNQSPSIFHWYAHFKKKTGIQGENSPSGGVETEELKERLIQLQNHFMILEKKEEYAKSTLIESQSKWTMFSKDILTIAKELIQTMEALQIRLTLNKVPLEPIQEKLARYEAFLLHNSDEI
jgi:hypothetical protein